MRNTTRAACRHRLEARQRARSRRSLHRGPPDRQLGSAAPVRDRERPAHRERNDAKRPCAHWSPNTRPEDRMQTNGCPAPLPGQCRAERPSHASRAETPHPSPLQRTVQPCEAPRRGDYSPSPATHPRHRKGQPERAPEQSESDRATPAYASPRAAPASAAA